jgi:long-chain fatty acid transport protein
MLRRITPSSSRINFCIVFGREHRGNVCSYYIAWDTWDKLVVDFTKKLPVPQQITLHKYHGSAIFRIGGQYELEGGFLLRAGVAYEQTPAPADYMQAPLPDTDAGNSSWGIFYPK